MAKNSIVWDWRSYFNIDMLQKGHLDEKNGILTDVSFEQNGHWAKAKTRDGCRVEISNIPGSYAECQMYEPWKTMTGSIFSRLGGDRVDKRHTCTCMNGRIYGMCSHQAALLIRWEKVHGPFVFDETEADAEIRRKAEEAKRLEALYRQKKETPARASALLNSQGIVPPDDLKFCPRALFSGDNTNFYEYEAAEKLLKTGEVPKVSLKTEYDKAGQQVLSAKALWKDNTVSMRFGRDNLISASCSCGETKVYSEYFRDGKTVRLCSHALASLPFIIRKMMNERPGDETDVRASRLLSAMSSGQGAQLPDSASDRKEDVTLSPRITVDKDSGKPQVSFTVGRLSGKEYVIRNLEKLVSAYENGEVFELTKKANIDFASEDVCEDSRKWLDFIQSRVREIGSINKKLSRSYYDTAALSAGSGVPLAGSALDIVYDLTKDSDIVYSPSGRGSEVTLRVGEAEASAEVILSPVSDDKGRLCAVEISGSMPQFLKGNQYQYVLDDTQFGRVSKEELRALEPLKAIADKDGSLSARIGLKKLPEFYYRVLPRWQENGQIRIIDRVGGIPEDVIPSEPDFRFYIDLVDRRILCRPVVNYGEELQYVIEKEGGEDLSSRDIDQEDRVRDAVESYFTDYDKDCSCFAEAEDDDTLARILTDGVDCLSQFGEVCGSDAFRKVKVYPAPRARVSLKIEGGLLDLSVQTADMDEDELLQLLKSYRLKKRWHRLKSGDYVDLEQSDQLEELSELADGLDVSPEELVSGDVQLPKYRALYVDKLLESHDELAASRDTNFKSLVRSFGTVKDSDFEVSEELKDIMRPYQTYGFRWLSTLAQAGFGGILADEMGLGKTLQMLAFLQQQKRGGEDRPALVVCPASLVYNWKEEAEKFTPDLNVELLAGTQAQRKPQLEGMAGEDHADLYVTSYDTLKRDIPLYEGTEFSDVVLDEAQFIKNNKTAASKAVKVLNAENRFALTGTPIENRLSELWSIFDFLMPGFLYTESEFESRFAVPIMKQKDEEATTQLSKMIDPFILRRKKVDVLKDLPEKLEEVKSQPMDEDQRRLYDAQVIRTKELLENSGENGEDKVRVLAEIMRLRQLCCDPSLLFDDYEGSSAKRSACLELVQSAIDGGHRILIFSQFTSMLDLLAEDLRDAGIDFYVLTGATPKEERVRLMNEFNNGDIPVFLISLRAGGTGLNLTGADIVIHYDPWWNLAVQNQATDRAHRIGQTRMVNVIKLIAADSIEERIVKLQETKRDLADAVLGATEGSIMSMSREELMALLE